MAVINAAFSDLPPRARVPPHLKSPGLSKERTGSHLTCSNKKTKHKRATDNVSSQTLGVPIISVLKKGFTDFFNFVKSYRLLFHTGDSWWNYKHIKSHITYMYSKPIAQRFVSSALRPLMISLVERLNKRVLKDIPAGQRRGVESEASTSLSWLFFTPDARADQLCETVRLSPCFDLQRVPIICSVRRIVASVSLFIKVKLQSHKKKMMMHFSYLDLLFKHVNTYDNNASQKLFFPQLAWRKSQVA